MSSQNNLEIKGNLREHPLAELLIEIFQARLTGSMRLSNAAQKTIVYFDAGDLVFAVSNSRSARLFEMFLREGKLTKEQLAAIPDFTNDIALRENLTKNERFPKEEIDALFVRQIEQILKEAFGWQEGEWIFSPLVRVKGDIRFKTNVSSLLLEFARDAPPENISRSIKSLEEVFNVKTSKPPQINLLPQEAFVLSRFEDSSLNVENVMLLSGLSDTATFNALYILWLGGYLTRQNWSSPFSDRKVAAILSANLTLIKDEPKSDVSETKADAAQFIPAGDEAAEELPAEKTISLEEYLERTENAPNYYEIFGVASDAPTAEIKRVYFTFARRFHPDLFHRQVEAEKHLQIQNAFTKIAHAYETLKNESSREVYDFKMRKELAETENSQAASANGADPNQQKQNSQAAINFEQGYTLLMNESYADALPFLARAAHLAQDNARYHAFYGKALSADSKHKYKAEAELQTAVKLDPDNADFRLMLAEFFVQMRLLKRAEGELNRLLSISPNNEAARNLLDSLAKT
ncbi:MAG: DnaJ domain-containing protein [Acidobacteriota bacterium]|nr:DnaJ domain-containing protein [Acidobacteriota bacterium]